MFELLWWQQLLLTVVFAVDVAVLANLARRELADWRLAHRPNRHPGWTNGARCRT